MFPEEALIFRIFGQAVEDYQDLKRRRKVKHEDASGCYSYKEIEKFFKGKWCERLLDMVDSQLTGDDILNKVKAQC